MTEQWYAIPAEQIAERLGASPSAGLARKAAHKRLRTEGENDVFALPHTPALTYAAYVVSDVSMLLLVLTAVLAAIWGHERSGILIFAVLALHCGAAIFTYIKARRIVESLAACTIPRARVLREGRVVSLDARRLVRGDIILLRPGDIIPGDARLLSATDLEVLEYAGRVEGKQRRVRVKKDASRRISPDEHRPMGEMANMVFAGAVVLAGEGRAVVVETGAATFLVSTEGPIPLATTRDSLPALESLRRYCGRASLGMLLLILPLTVLGLLIPGEWNLLDYFLLALSLAVSSMSELTAAIGYIIVGAALRRAAKTGAVLPHPADLPALARADTLVLLDDTALTEGKITVTAAFRGLDRAELDDSALAELYETALLTAALPGNNLASGTSTLDGATEALLEAAAAHGVTGDSIRAKLHLADYAPPSPTNPFATALTLEQGAPYANCAGDAAALLARCTRAVDPATVGGTCMLRADRRDALLAACAAETASGGYAVAYARRSSPYNTLSRLSVLQDQLILVGVLVFRDPVADGVAEAVRDLREAGVRTLLMADRPRGGGAIEALACAAGISEVGTVARHPAPIPDDATLCIGYPAAARKAHLDRLRASGHTTVGLGAQASDLTALQACTVAASCAPVEYGAARDLPTDGDDDYGCALLTKNAGLIVRRPDDGIGAVAGFAEAHLTARRIERNLACALRCLLATQAMRLVAVVGLLCLKLPVVTPLQLLIGGLLLDFGAILVCAFDRRGDRLAPDGLFDHPLRRNLPRLALGLVCGVAVAVGASVMLKIGMLPDRAAASSFVFTSLTLGQLALLFTCRRGAGLSGRSRMGFVWPVAVLAFLGLGFAFPTFGSLFGLTALPTAASLCLTLVPLIALFGGELAYLGDGLTAISREEEPDDPDAP